MPLVQFSPTYLCESAYSRYSMMKATWKTKMYAVADLRLRLSPITPDFSNWCVHHNSLILCHTEKLIHSSLFCFVDWLNRPQSFIAILSTIKKSLQYPFTFCYTAYTANWTRMGFGEIIHSGIGLHSRRSLIALFYDIFSCGIENCASTT
jgi:Zn-dependent oligopeptidase